METRPEQRWLHDLIERIDAVVWEADPETLELRYVSPSAERLLGFPTSAWLTPGFWMDRVHPEDRERVVADCRSAADSRDRRTEYRLVAADGSEVWVEDDVRLVRAPDGTPFALRGVLIDATARRREETMLRFVLEHSSDVITIVDADGVIRYESPAIEPILGYAQNELLGTNAFDLIHPDDLARARETLAGALRTHGFTEPVEVRFKHRDGTWRWLESIGRNMVGGQAGAVLVTSRDITMQRRANEARKLEALGRLANTIAHDFNNILFVIKGHAELLRNTVSSAHWASLWELIGAADRGSALTHQLLSFGRHTADEVACDPSLVVRELVSMVRPVIGEGIDLSAAAEYGVPDVAIGRGVFEQIVLNLVLNARDALSDGGHITISVASDGARVRVRVEDDGEGMDDETRRHIFEPFFTTKSIGKGTGLGLATVLAIVTKHGGDVEVESSLGSGTAVELSLPQAMSTQATVLVADDDELVRRVVGEALAETGYRILFADSAPTALAIDEAVDLALVDGHLDRQRRSDLGGELRRRDPGVRIVVMTGLPDAEDYEFADAVLAKPFAFDELRATLARLLNDR